MAEAMTGLGTAFDGALALALVGCAAVALTSANLFKATVLFIVYGVLMAVAWGRLGAVDIALAEAAIGAGITGALLLHAQGDLAVLRAGAPSPSRAADRRRAATRVATVLAVIAIAALLVWAIIAAPVEHAGLGPVLAEHLQHMGAENPVTAVLLNARAHDTLLEIVVLLAAVVGAWSLNLPAPPRAPPPGLILRAAASVLVPITVLIGGYLLWRGAFAPGGAFQAGAVLAGAMVLAALANARLPQRGVATPLRLGLAAGTVVFVAAGAYGPLRGRPFLHYRGDAAEIWIIAIEVAATVSIALALAAVLSGRAPGEQEASA